jgi:hypothetical protein
LERVPVPADAIDDDFMWFWDEDPSDPPTFGRLFDVRRWTVPVPERCDAEIAVGAQQIVDVVEVDGGWRVENCRIAEWEMHVQTDNIETADQARQLAAALVEAADELQTRQASQ